MATHPDRFEEFRALHVPGRPLLIPNPWDVGSAKVLVSLGFEALATTSGGFAGTLGRLDGEVGRDETLAHAAALAAAVTVPVSADLESCFGDDPAEVAETVRRAAETGLAGCSIEDYDRHGDVILPLDVAVERVAAAAEAAHAGPRRLVLTARADSHFHGGTDLEDTIRRLEAYEEAGADVLYAPNVSAPEELRRILAAVSLPVNVLGKPGGPSVAELAELGVARVSVGSAFYSAAMGELVDSACRLRDEGTFGYGTAAGAGRAATQEAFREAGRTR
jgi:2-methylisocitrate lyase-like PEP mutase family enzyme